MSDALITFANVHTEPLVNSESKDPCMTWEIQLNLMDI